MNMVARAGNSTGSMVSYEQVEEMIEKLEIDKNKLSLDKVSEIYKKYGFDIHDYKDLRFEN